MTRRFRWFTAVLVGFALLALPACGDDSDDEAAPAETEAEGEGEGQGEFVSISGVPGVTDEEIGFAVVATKANNPLGTCILDCYVDGIEAYFAFRNSQGGVHGRDLVIAQELDDEVGQNQVRALEVISGGKSFGAFSATLVASGWPDLDKAGVPTYVLGTNPAVSTGLAANFPQLHVPCLDCPQIVWAEGARAGKATKVASIGYGVSDVAKKCVTTMAKTIDTYGEGFGAENAYFNDDLPFGLSNGLGPEVAAMKRAGVDFVASCMDLNGNKTLAQELKRQGMSDVVIFHQNTYDQKFVSEAGDLFEGDILRVFFRPFEADAEGTGLADFKKWMEETGSEMSENALVGWVNADLAYQGLLAAGPEFDRESVIAATNELTAWDADGLLVPVDWTKGHDAPTTGDHCGTLVKVVDGKFETVAPADKPWLCWEQVDEWSEPVTVARPTTGD